MGAIRESLKNLRLSRLEPRIYGEVLRKRGAYNDAHARYAGLLATLVAGYLLISNLRTAPFGSLPAEQYLYYRRLYSYMIATGLMLLASERAFGLRLRRLKLVARGLAYTGLFILVTLLLGGDFGRFRDFSAYIVIQFLLGQLISAPFWLYPAIQCSHFGLALAIMFRSSPTLFVGENAWILPLLYTGLTLALAYTSESGRRKTWIAEAELSRANEALREASFLDPLTGLYNRRYLDEVLKAAGAAVRRGGGCLTVIMIDVDHFKSVNDRHGHQVGDEVLVYLARVIKESLRDSDIAARFGGEEFIVALPRTDAAGGLATADRLLERCRGEAPPGLGDPVTVSAGVASLGTDEATEGMIRRADAALYEAKRKGRDRACLSPDA